MQTTIVMLLALSGLGCHHKPCDSACFPPPPCATDLRYAVDYETVVEPSLYNPCRGAGCLSTSWTRAAGDPRRVVMSAAMPAERSAAVPVWKGFRATDRIFICPTHLGLGPH